jgi:hypothetical protein
MSHSFVYGSEICRQNPRLNTARPNCILGEPSPAKLVGDPGI